MIKGLHHIGIASKNIDKDINFFNLFGYKPKNMKIEDNKTGIFVQFMEAENQPDIELVQNIEKNGPMTEHLQSRRKIFHYAYITDNINNDMQNLINNGGGVILVPLSEDSNPDSTIKKWCYLIFRNMMIVELVELK